MRNALLILASSRTRVGRFRMAVDLSNPRSNFVLTYSVCGLIKGIVLPWNIIEILWISLLSDSEILQWENGRGVIEDVEKCRVSPPRQEIVLISGGGGRRANQAIDRSRSGGGFCSVIPCVAKLCFVGHLGVNTLWFSKRQTLDEIVKQCYKRMSSPRYPTEWPYRPAMRSIDQSQ